MTDDAAPGRLSRVAPVGLDAVAAVRGGGVVRRDDPALGGEDESPSSTVELTLLWGKGCPHCAAERDFLDELQATRPYVVVHEYEVLNDGRNRRLFREMAAAAGIDAGSVPTTFLGERVRVGFGDQIAAEIGAAVDAFCEDCPVSEVGESVVDVRLIGPVRVGDRSLLVSTVLIGFVDGVNPCSLWVLSILLPSSCNGGSRWQSARGPPPLPLVEP